MTLRLSRRHVEAISAQGAAAYPEECCGVLIGSETDPAADPSSTVQVERVHPFPNAQENERARRYVIDPLALSRLEDELEQTAHQIVGIYHSHPDHPAAPSEFDRTHAWPGLSYAIIRVAQGLPEVLTSWRLTADRDRFIQEDVDIIP